MGTEKKNKKTMPEGMEINLCDFALFLSVMKNKEAHEITLSIIMENPDLHLDEVHVEEVVLNNCGKRAIRLDAWARDTDGTQYNTEMQNDIQNDDMRKRSRYYQGLMDAPILKSGKETKYKQLPSTVIIFITKEDIFGRDLAKYTFTEQCEEIADLHLEDGTTKIFLNMSSKNGTPELVSLLQYMKKTTLDNPNIVLHDERLCKLDSIVNEITESEEWEDVKMSIYSSGLERGREMGKEIGKEIGKEVGQLSHRMELICKKLKKEKTLEEVAEELEEDIDTIRPIYEFASRFAPEYDWEKITEAWFERKKQI